MGKAKTRNPKLKCKDCGALFTRMFGSQRKKCWNCLDRDQSYRERAIQEMMDNHAPEDTAEA